jgi:UDP-glucose 6-dehydrogenase
MLFTSRRTAELTKYAANAFLATKITFINEIADLCEKVGANVQEVARGIGLDNRIGSKFLHAGPGYGGSCFPKDTLALIKTAQDYAAPIRIVETVAAVNDQRKRAMGRKVVAACGGNVRGKTVAVLGLTFKPNTDDMRDAPSLAVIAALQDAGAKVRAYDPEGMEQAKAVLSDVDYAPDPYACAEGADALDELLPLIRRELRRRGAVAVHGNRRTDFVAAVCAAHLHEAHDVDPVDGLARAAAAGLEVTPDAAVLLGVDYDAVQPRSRSAASTSSGRSVTT